MTCITYGTDSEFVRMYQQTRGAMGDAAALALINQSGGPARDNGDGTITICAPGDTLGPATAVAPGGGTPIDPGTVVGVPSGAPVPAGAQPLYPTIADTLSQLIPTRLQIFGAATGVIVLAGAAFFAFAFLYKRA